MDLDLDWQDESFGGELYCRMWTYARIYESCPLCEAPRAVINMFCAECAEATEPIKGFSDNDQWVELILDWVEQRKSKVYVECAECGTDVDDANYLCSDCRNT
jgi:ribosomal protein S14